MTGIVDDLDYNRKGPRDSYESCSSSLLFFSSYKLRAETGADCRSGNRTAKNASLRMRNSSTSRTLQVLDPGDKVDVLERRDNWYRVRYGSDVQGWMEESTLVTNEMKS